MRIGTVLAATIFLLARLASAETIRVPAGGDLQAAVERARPGDSIWLESGAVYTGNFVLSRKDGGTFITIRTEPTDGLPRSGQRIAPVHAPRLAKLQSPNRQPVVRTQAAAHHWRLALLEFLPLPEPAGDVIALGDGSPSQSDADQVPHSLILDQCYIHGDPDRGQKRGIALNSGSTAILNSYISGMWSVGQDSQAIAGWNGPGPYRIENNYLEAASENFMLGGAEPSIRGLVPTDVVFRRNHLSKPLAWRERKGLAVKTLLELKSGRDILIEGNLLEHCWRDAQTGFAIVITPRGERGRAPWVSVENITIRYNLVRHTGGGINMLGRDDAGESGPARGILVEHNVFAGIDGDKWGGTGTFLQIGLAPSDVAVVHNTILQSDNIISAHGRADDGNRILGFQFRDNIARHNRFGVHGQGRSVGQDSLDVFFPAAQFSSNAIEGGDRRRYPDDNLFLQEGELSQQFVNPARGDYRVRRGSTLSGAASDKRDLGADVARLHQMLGLRVSSDPRSQQP